MSNLQRLFVAAINCVAASILAADQSAIQQDRQEPAKPVDISVLMIADKSVQADLRCRADQKQAIRRLLDRYDQRIWTLRDVPPAEAHGQLEPLIDEVTQGLDKVLIPYQQERFKQIILQRQGPDALLTSELIQNLGLSERQVKQLRAVTEDTRIRLANLARTSLLDKGPTQRQREAYEIRSHERELILAVLTEEQKKTWIKLRGREFKFDQLQPMPVRAPELRDAEKTDRWLNSKPLTLSGLRGQVVIVHFWTFSCINCRRNYWAYNGWLKDYANRGVTIIGIHTPEIPDDYKLPKLQDSVKAHELTFPILIDNSKKNWDAWANCVWPSVYLIDRTGYIRNWWYGELKGPNPDQDMEKWVRTRIEALLNESGPSSRPS